MTMRMSVPGVTALAAILAAPAAAATYWRKPAAVPGFGGVRAELQRLVDAEGHARVNHFCAVVEDVHEPPSASSEGNSQQLIVRWAEAGRIYTYGPADGGRIGPNNRDESAEIDLRTGIAASEKDIGGSTVRVTGALIDGLIAHCRNRGVGYTIVRHGR